MPPLPPIALTAADTLAFAMVALLGFALGMIVTILFVMARTGSSRPDLGGDIFEEEEETSHNVEAGDQPKEVAREEWEQDPDWWKK